MKLLRNLFAWRAPLTDVEKAPPATPRIAAEASRVDRLPPRPVVLARKPRERGRDWSQDRSWFGGLPRLGGASWPKGADGRFLPFAAQIDLAEVAIACPESPLPQHGALAFFLNDGAVIHVAAGQHAPATPPEGLPPAYEEGGYPLPESPTRTSRPLFPYWPVEPIGLPLPEELRAYSNEDRHEEIWAAQHALLKERAPPREYSFSVYSARKEKIEGADDLWWLGVQHLVASLHNAVEGASRLIAKSEEWRHRASQHLLTLETSPNGTEAALFKARAELDKAAAQVSERQHQARELPDFIADLERLAAGRDPWARLSADELDIIRRVLTETRDRFGELARFHVPHSIDELANLCIRRMITGDGAALAALPEPMLKFLNENYRLPTISPHQMFGLAGVKQSALYDHLDDLLLLQISYDDMNEWRFGDMGLWHFWIARADASDGRWERAKLTFECA